MRRSLATLKLMIVEQSTHELQKMFGRRTYAVKISHGLGLADPLAEQSYKSGDRSYGCLDVVRDGKQESLTLLHDSFGLVLGFYYALMVAPLATNIAQRINYQHNGSTNGEQCQHSNLHHSSASGSHVGIDSTLHGVVLIALNVLKHLSGTPRQLYADKLERTGTVVDSILPASVGTLYLMMDVGKSLSHRICYVDALSHGSGVGASALHRSGYSVGTLSTKGITQSAEESASGTDYIVNRFAVAGVGNLVGMNHYRVASALQVVHLAGIDSIARSVGKYVEHHHGIVALGSKKVGKRVHAHRLDRIGHKLLQLHCLALRLRERSREALPLPRVAHHDRTLSIGSIKHAVNKAVDNVASLHKSLRSIVEISQRTRTVVHHLRCKHEHNGKNGIAGDYLQT